MRTSKRLGWSLFACDAATTALSRGTREAHPFAFGSKPLGIALSAAATWGALRAEEKYLRDHRPGVADLVRFGPRRVDGVPVRLEPLGHVLTERRRRDPTLRRALACALGSLLLFLATLMR